MNGIYLIIVILAVLGFYMFFNKKRIEGFGDFYSIQSDYQNTQSQNFDLIDKAVYINTGLSLNPVKVNNAFRKVGKSPDINYSALFQEDDNALRERDFQFCRNAAHPRNLSRAPRASLGCAWWYVESTGRSTGALGTLTNPIDTTLASQFPGGRWIWSLDEAARLEDIKRCKAVKSCLLIDLPGIKGECGFCPEKGYAIPVNSRGQSKYPDDDENTCGEDIILDSTNCRRINEPITSQQVTDEDIQYDNNGNMISRRISGDIISEAPRDVCDPDSRGNLSLDCLLVIAKANGMNESGAIAKLIRNRTSPNELDVYSMKVLKEVGNILIPDAIYTTGSIDLLGAGIIMKNITDLMMSPNSRISSAAKYLSIGLADYNICDFGDNEQGPFPTTCLQREFRKAGCQPAGTSAPNERNASTYDNKTFGVVRSEFGKIFKAMKEAKTQDAQNDAMMGCLGTELYKKRPEACDEAGMEYIVYSRKSDGTPDGFIGRFISKKGLITPRLWSWDTPNAVEKLISKTPSASKYYIIRTFASIPTSTSMSVSGNLPTDSAEILINGQQQAKRYLWTRSSDKLSGTQWNFVMLPKIRNKIEIINGGPTARFPNVGFPSGWDYSMTNLDRFQLKQESWRPLISLDFFRSSLTDFNDIVKLQPNNNVVLGDLGGKRCALFLRKQGNIQFSNGIHTDNFGTITMMVYMNSVGTTKSLFIGENRSENPSSLFFIGNPANRLSFIHASYTSNGQLNKYWRAKSSDGSNDLILNSSTGRWVHLSFIFYNNKKGIAIFENGVLIGNAGSESEIQTSLLNNIILGNELDGGIAWFHIYDYKLTPEEIKRDMNYDNPKYEIQDVPLEDIDLLAGKYEVVAGKDYPGNDIASMSSTSVKDCALECYSNKNCVGFQYNDMSKTCFLKNKTGPLVDSIPEANAGLMINKPRFISTSRNNRYMIDVSGVSKNNGAAIHMWDKWDGPNQKWTFTGDGRIKSVNSDKCMDVYAGMRSNGTGIIQWDCHGGDNQKFTVDGMNRIHPMHAPEKCLDISGPAYDHPYRNGGRLQIWDCYDGPNQKWNITPTD